MKVDQEAGLLYVFKHSLDPWLNAVYEYCTGPLGWESYEWRAEMDSNGAACPTMFAQLLTVYRFRGLTPEQAMDELVLHPDYSTFAKAWRDRDV